MRLDRIVVGACRFQAPASFQVYHGRNHSSWHVLYVLWQFTGHQLQNKRALWKSVTQKIDRAWVACEKIIWRMVDPSKMRDSGSKVFSWIFKVIFSLWFAMCWLLRSLFLINGSLRMGCDWFECFRHQNTCQNASWNVRLCLVRGKGSWLKMEGLEKSRTARRFKLKSIFKN